MKKTVRTTLTESHTKAWTRKYPLMRITSTGEYYVFFGDKCFNQKSYDDAVAIWKTVSIMGARKFPLFYSSNFFMRGSKLLIMLKIVKENKKITPKKIRKIFSEICPSRASDCSCYLSRYSQYFYKSYVDSNPVYAISNLGLKKLADLNTIESEKIRLINNSYNVIYS